MISRRRRSLISRRRRSVTENENYKSEINVFRSNVVCFFQRESKDRNGAPDKSSLNFQFKDLAGLERLTKSCTYTILFPSQHSLPSYTAFIICAYCTVFDYSNFVIFCNKNFFLNFHWLPHNFFQYRSLYRQCLAADQSHFLALAIR